MKEVLDATITGDITQAYTSSVEQYDADAFAKAIQDAFDAGVTAIAWTQYTPYFNDGDPCVFNVHSEGIFSTKDGLTSGELNSAPIYELEDDDYDIWEDTNLYKYVRDPEAKYGYREEVVPDNPQKAAVRNLIKDIRHYYLVLQRNFGDHAKVVATPDGYRVEYYEHD